MEDKADVEHFIMHRHDTGGSTLVQAADAALYQLKRVGRNRATISLIAALSPMAAIRTSLARAILAR